MSELAPFPVALKLRAQSVLVIGGDAEALDKLPKLLSAGARVTLVAEQILPELKSLLTARSVLWFRRGLHPSDVQGASLVLLTEPDELTAKQLRALKSRHAFWLCAIDQPALSDVYLVASVTQGPVQISISTGGQAPLLARAVRRALERAFDQRFGEFARKFAELRERLRALPKLERKERLEAALNGFAIEVSVRYPADHRSDASGSGTI